MSDYVCTKKPLETPQAIDAFRKALMDTAIYKKPSDYMTVGQHTLSITITFRALLWLFLCGLIAIVCYDNDYIYQSIHFANIFWILSLSLTCTLYLLCQCRDTYWIETFHVVILIYAAKRINFGDDTYIMRVQLAALDWVCFSLHCICMPLILVYAPTWHKYFHFGVCFTLFKSYYISIFIFYLLNLLPKFAKKVDVYKISFPITKNFCRAMESLSL